MPFTLDNLIRAIEKAAWVEIAFNTDGEGWWLARAMVEADHGPSYTIENASGSSKLEAVCKLAMKLQPRSKANLDSLIEAMRGPVGEAA